MAKAIVDPAELRRFAQDLRRFNAELNDRMKALQGRMHQLSASWRDQEQAKFAESFEETLRVLHRFHLASEEHIPMLLRKAERAEAYLDQR